MIPRDRPDDSFGNVISFPAWQIPSGGSPVERIDLFRIYQLGNEIHPLADFPDPPAPLASVFFHVVNGLAAVRGLLGIESPARIELSRHAATELLGVLQDFDKANFRGDDGNFLFPDKDAPVPPWMSWRIRDAVKTFEAVFRAEMQNTASYRVPKRGTYHISDLVDRADMTFSSVVYHEIGDMAVSEYKAAGKCYAFGLYTASGYHSCRAAESVLREYYRIFTGKDDTGNEPWGQLVKELEHNVEGRPAVPARTIEQIKHLKDYYRNPLSHLRSVLEEIDADVLLSGAKVAMTAMARDILDKKEKESVQPTLQLVPPDDEEAA